MEGGMKLAVGSDKAGYELKEQVKAYLCKNGHEVEDLGTENPQIPFAYYEAAHNVCVHIRDGKAERGILICGTGAGMCIHANKHQGIFAVVSESVYSAKLCRIINDANVLTFGSRIVPPDMAYEMVDAFIGTSFVEGMEAERAGHLSRQQKNYKELEQQWMCGGGEGIGGVRI
ncbi:RpiB/LacA/LacB family sugar-phosphate isomerase [Clostridiales bacterium TF09-2AC]|nr:RpiB/LacA/LacB family sugar-phosphate isomerase [Clostridiales bacterium TF09-2AC]